MKPCSAETMDRRSTAIESATQLPALNCQPRSGQLAELKHVLINYLEVANSAHTLSHASHAFAQSAIGFMSEFLPHSLPQALQAFRQASASATAIGPFRSQSLAQREVTSMQSSERRMLDSCSFIPPLTIAAQCLWHARQAFSQSRQAFAQRA